ncbi:MAG: hypothetical protein WCK42_08395 [Myxococcaceae bacterium]
MDHLNTKIFIAPDPTQESERPKTPIEPEDQFVSTHIQPLADQLAHAHPQQQTEINQKIFATTQVMPVLEQIKEIYGGTPLDAKKQSLLVDMATNKPEDFKQLTELIDNPHITADELVSSTAHFPEPIQSMFSKIATLQATRTVQETTDRFENMLGGIPLAPENKELLSTIASKHPDIFKQLSDYSKNPTKDLSSKINESLANDNADTSTIKQLIVFSKEMDAIQDLQNTQFNSDELDGGQKAERRKSNLLSFNKKPGPQKESILKAQQYAIGHDFGQTRWFPGGLSGQGLLFCADWEPVIQTKGSNSFKISRHIGIMLGDQVQMTRVEANIPGNFTAEQKKKMLENFSTVQGPEAKAFREDCEKAILKLHAELRTSLQESTSNNNLSDSDRSTTPA